MVRSSEGASAPDRAQMWYALTVNVGNPATALISDLEAAILGVLARTTRPMTGREIARLSEKSEHGTKETLRRLVKHGLVRRENLSVGALYRLNREHLALEVVLELLELRQKLIQRVRTEIARWDIAPTNASIFGSSARGDGGIESDIDLLIVRPRNVPADAPKWRDQVADLRDRVFNWTGNECNILEIAETSVSSLARDRPDLAHGLARDGVLVAGAPLKEPSASNREVEGRLGIPFQLRSSQLAVRELVS